ncbi:KIN14B-interacting protein At4g14310 [Abrus precatorius]|uniref:KIN14B-interacting protein At4g14310 n=1 Tax=Abrus precatorius TaxID=3816 RepID=A0A8B8M9D4_ABRPR|nr:KIN14B-interacting protein At4g14310 [Abrus precatorius]
MSSTRRGGENDAATFRRRSTTRSTTPLSATRKFPSPSLLKENSNPRRSTSRGPTHNPTLKPRGRSSSPSLDRPIPNNLAHTKPISKPTTAQKLKPSTTTTRSSLEVNKTSQLVDHNNTNNNNKYPSRLHEKLAFLEGKVKRIASDIKKTKEMLDMNNPDASKVILSDIQDKISGIEKAMVHVVSKNNDSENCSDNKQLGVVGGGDDDVGIQNKSLVKGLNNEELEARLFPHQKLLRDRTVVKEEEKVLSPVDDNSVAVEFLASLGEEKEKVFEEVKDMDGGNGKKGGNGGWNNAECDIDVLLAADEKLEEFDDQENRQGEIVGEEVMDEAFNFKLNEIGNKVASGGWFVNEGEAVLLAHHDGSCSYYDIANCEEKAVYMPPAEISPNMWRDCWIIRAPGSDGCSGRFVVAASAGNTLDSGFCSWDFYTKEVRALQVEAGTASSRTALRPLPNNIVHRRNSTSGIVAAEAKQWWYRPCGPLIISTACSQRSVKVFDVRDGEQIMKWDVQKPVQAMEYSSPLQWRNRGKVVVAEAESVSLWDVNSIVPQALVSVPTTGRKVSALHVSNTDAELGGGVRKRVSSSEAEGHDGVFCTSDSINVLDFRQPSGVGLKISKHGVNAQSVFSRGDSVFLGCTSTSSMGKKQSSPLLQQFSLRRQGLFSIYALPDSNAHSHHAAIPQVWGNSDFVMGVCGLGLFVFDALKDDALRVLNMDYSSAQSFREVIGPDDLYWPSFDYLGSRALLISRDRPAMWRHLIA